jgi:hypothetical protein
MARRLHPWFIMKRHDRPGHIDPAHAERLLEWSRLRHEQEDDDAFLRANAEDEGLGSQLGQTAVANMTSGDAGLTDEFDAPVEEEVGGPFVVTSAKDDFDEDIDLSDLDLPRPTEQANEADVDETDADWADAAETNQGDDEPAPSAPRSWGTIYLPRAKELAGWLGKHMFDGAVTLTRSVRPKPR